MAVVADVHADLADGRLEDRVAQVPRTEVELLPEALDVRDVGLAVLAEVRAVRIDHGSGVVVDARGALVLLVHRGDDDHAGLLREVLHALRGGPVGDQLGVAVVLGVLDLAEIRPVEEFLEEDELGALLRGFVGTFLVLLDHRFLVAGPAGLDERATDGSGHRLCTSHDGVRGRSEGRVHRPAGFDSGGTHSGRASGRRRMYHSVNSRQRPSSSNRQTNTLANSRSTAERSSVR